MSDFEKRNFEVVTMKNNQQVALYRLIYHSKSAVHVSGDVFAHYHEHLTVFTVSGSVYPSCFRLVSRMGHQPAATWVQQVLLIMGENIAATWVQQVLLIMGENIARNI